MKVKNKIKEHYNKNPEREWDRLDRYGIEFYVTMKHLLKNLKPNSNILDVGGGPGRYSFYLSSLGHEVYLTDLSDGNIDLVCNREIELGIKLKEEMVCDAEDLSQYKDNTFDAVNNFGPLYHTQKKELRNKIISESLRVVKTDGLCSFAYLSIYAPTYDLLKKDSSKIIDNYDNLLKYIDTGLHTESKNRTWLYRYIFNRSI